MKFAGFSLSFCVSAILSDKVKLEQVEYIVPGFNYQGGVSENYFATYWRNWPKSQVVALLEKITFRRIYETPGVNIARGIWYPAGEELIPLFNQDEFAHWRLRTEDLNKPLVRCISNANEEWLTVGKIYAVQEKDSSIPDGKFTDYILINDDGHAERFIDTLFEPLNEPSAMGTC